jgi:hypothetical protein
MSKSIGLDDVIEDIFSLNLRGIKSIATLWRNPKRYFEAAAETDWNNAYTPSVRLWLSLIALASLLQFFWIGADTPMVDAYAQGFQNAGAIPPDGMTHAELAETTALMVFAVFPIVQLLIFLVILPRIRLWGRATTYGLRLRYGFALMVPSTSLSVIILPSMALLPPDQVSIFGAGIGLLALLVDASTVYRGGAPGQTGTGRVARSVLLAAIILLMNFTAHMIVQTVCIILTYIRYGVYVP